jgi:energy-coupling factor transporter transmembrane protein EcfT
MIPAAGGLWRPTDPLPLRDVHPATRLGGGVLAVLTALLAPAPALVPLLSLVGWLLVRAGLRPGGLAGWLTPWWPVALLVVLVHAVTATDAAPLFRPSLVGLGRGGLALIRLSTMLLSMALLMRLVPLPDLVGGLSWWLRPLRPLGVDTRHLGVTLAVALGTAPRTQAEAARLLACLRLRTADGRPRRGLRLRDRLRVLPPLMEGIVRRGETLPLALAGRVGLDPVAPVPLPWRQGLVLTVWSVLLVVVRP